MNKVESVGGIINEFDEVVIVFTDTKSWQFPKGRKVIRIIFHLCFNIGSNCNILPTYD
ncbi:MAG TPA: hypothetical protein VMR16_02310 [Candidatus Saccharimonadales bacterium]|nr:hypothetical protein [Candidatus Saccharimonadales bacterium]